MSVNSVLPLNFAAKIRSSEDEVVVALHGELDVWTQSQFLAALDGVGSRFARVVLDLANLTFIDAGSLGIIHRARHIARLRGSDLVLRSPNPHLRRVLELTGLLPDTSSDDQPPCIVLPLPSRAYERAALLASGS